LGLLALMLLHDSRRDARIGPGGRAMLLADQDRSLWDRRKIEEGLRVLHRALPFGRPGAYQLQAAIAALHVEAPDTTSTDWPQIAALYGELARIDRSPVVELNRAVAVAMAEGPERGLALIDGIDGLASYHLLHAARADLLHRAGRDREAADAYERAIGLTANFRERELLEKRVAELSP
jgi:predicted RNA polymerase sigma factor